MAYAFKSGGEKLQRTLAESFFHGYFENEQDPGQSPYLIRIAVETGVFANEVEAKNWFESNDQWTEVRAGYKTAQAMGITGVPFFVFENRYAISGAQPPEAFVEIFEKLAEEKGLKVGALATNGVHEADACDIDRKNC